MEVRLDGRTAHAVAMDDIKGRIGPVVTKGRAPERLDEILLSSEAAWTGSASTSATASRRETAIRCGCGSSAAVSYPRTASTSAPGRMRR